MVDLGDDGTLSMGTLSASGGSAVPRVFWPGPSVQIWDDRSAGASPSDPIEGDAWESLVLPLSAMSLRCCDCLARFASLIRVAFELLLWCI